MNPNIEEIESLAHSIRETFYRRGTEYSVILAVLLRALMDVMHQDGASCYEAGELLATTIVKFVKEKEAREDD